MRKNIVSIALLLSILLAVSVTAHRAAIDDEDIPIEANQEQTKLTNEQEQQFSVPVTTEEENMPPKDSFAYCKFKCRW